MIAAFQLKYLFSVFLITCCLFPTPDSTAQPAQEYKFHLYWSPFRIIDDVNPGLDIGIAMTHNKKLSTQFSLGYMHELINMGAFDGYHGYRLAVEEKYFIHTHKKMRYFLSVEWVYLNCTFQYEDYFKEPLPELKSSTHEFIERGFHETYKVNKTTNTGNLRVGFQFAFKRFVMEVSGGIGLKHKRVFHTGRTAPLEWRDIRHPNVNDAAAKDGNYWTGNVPFNFRIGYWF